MVAAGDFGGGLDARDECLAGRSEADESCVADSLEWRVLRRRELAVVLAASVVAADEAVGWTVREERAGGGAGG